MLQPTTADLAPAADTTPEDDMDDSIRDALRSSRTIDITTHGRRTGLPRRIEIVFHNFGGRLFISGLPSPRKRAWIANLEADPHLTFHLKAPAATADLPATARIITDPAERRTIMALVAAAWRRTDIETMVETSPLIEVTLDPVPG
jgi:deazaflavin-dependent oxidoreductase (nitroreductase family)